MILYPDFTIVKTIIISIPYWSFVFIALAGITSACYLRLVFRSVTSLSSRFIYSVIILFAVFHLLLISVCLLCYEIIFLLYNNRLKSGKDIKPLFLSCCLLIFLTFFWTLYIQIGLHYNVDIQMTFVESIRKLYNYPKIYEKVVKPIFDYRIFFEIAISFVGIAISLYIKLPSLRDKCIALTLLLILFCFFSTGLANTYYSHIRYFYYIYPLILFFISVFIVFLWTCAGRNKFFKNIITLAVAAFLVLQITVDWTKVIKATPTSQEMFSLGRKYTDTETCCNYLKRVMSPGDYVIAFASAHQNAVYCGAIDACIRPHLMEHMGKTHYITGSLYFDTIEDLIAIIIQNTERSNTIWIIADKSMLKNGSWQYEFIKKIKDHTLCRAMDKKTTLVKLSQSEALSFLNYPSLS